ncbi:hypothetical protein HanRHA438_Chr02g0084331 [Helianthus annuus]|nr:hypothetical protein HanRHA438_Chr02g0084331 [Helianthus annuus]
MFFKIITGTTGLLTAPIPARWGRGRDKFPFSYYPTSLLLDLSVDPCHTPRSHSCHSGFSQTPLLYHSTTFGTLSDPLLRCRVVVCMP